MDPCFHGMRPRLQVLGNMPQKTFNLSRVRAALEPFVPPPGLDALTALGRVLRLLSVGSKVGVPACLLGRSRYCGRAL